MSIEVRGVYKCTLVAPLFYLNSLFVECLEVGSLVQALFRENLRLPNF